MFSAITRFLKRHQKKIFATLGITGGAYLAGKWAKWKLAEMQERATAERKAKENMRRRFHQRQIDCTCTVLSHNPTLAQQLLDDFDVESIFANLQKAKNYNKENNGEMSSNTTSLNASAVLVNGHTTTSTSSALINSDINESTISTPSSSLVLVDRPIESDNEIAKATETTTHNRGEISDGIHPDNAGQENGMNSSLSNTVNTSEENGKMTKQVRYELWTEIKIKSFIRTVAAVYLETFLTLIIFVQLNLLGRYNYLYSVSLTERDKEQMITIKPYNGSLLNSVTEQKYLTFFWWFLNVGYKEIVARVRAAVESSLSSMSFKNELSYQDFVWLISEIRSKIEGPETTDNDGPTHKFFNVMMPENFSDEIRILRECGENMFDTTIDSELRKLLDETKDFIHSRDFATVLSACLKAAFNLLYHDMHPHFYYDDQLSGERVEKNVILTKLLPHITRETHHILNGVPPRFHETIKDCNELQAFAAIIYASFDD